MIEQVGNAVPPLLAAHILAIRGRRDLPTGERRMTDMQTHHDTRTFDDGYKAGYAAARRHYGEIVRRALEHLRERLLDMAATRMPPLFRDQLLELAEVAKTALGEVEKDA